MNSRLGNLIVLGLLTGIAARGADIAKTMLAREVHSLGWIAFSAATPAGDWDLFIMRPDGSERRKLTDTREFNETGVRFSPDGKRILYYRQPAKEPVDNNTYGTFELIIADATGTQPVSFGNEFPWATWGPDGKSFAALKPDGIQIVDIATRKTVRKIPRKGLVQQLAWSPDGASFTGTANGLGPYWNIGCLRAGTAEISAVSETERYNCTPDWIPDSRHIVYARGIIPKDGGRAELWIASADGKEKRMLYAEAGRHIYGACASPDGRHLLFTRSEEDLGRVDHAKTTMALIRVADAPMLGDQDKALRKRFPNAKPVRRLDLGPGWEPHWTKFEIPNPKR
jgi:Tol biopolymer transport system component